MLIINLPYNEMKFYPEVKSQTGLSSVGVSRKRALTLVYKLIKLGKKQWQRKEANQDFLKDLEKLLMNFPPGPRM